MKQSSVNTTLFKVRKNHNLEKFISYIFMPLLLGTIITCGSKNKPQENTSGDIKQKIMQKPGCDSALWERVYNPERLEVYNMCVTVSGVIEERKSDDDGDEHMLLRLDKGFEEYINKRNEKKKEGCLVIEAVCVNNVNRKKVGQVCEGYVNNILLPNVGDHVRVTGSHVKDTNNDNGWMEIHPIMNVEIIK